MEKKEIKKVRTRFAPSPTGEMHIGGARTALFNYLFAKHCGGELILRIEDTDQKRFVPGATERIVDNLNWLGIKFDEGVTKKDGKISQTGEFGPYIQTQRLEIYQKYAQELVGNGHAYYCFCTEERLEKMREEQKKNQQAPKYDRTCLKLHAKEIQEKLDQKVPYVIRLKVPEGKTLVKDLIFGDIGFDYQWIDDQVLVKSNGIPTYHLAVVVDDHLMKISHVLRGEEWLPSLPKQVILYDAFGWERPAFAHLPTILDANRKKLSKRDGSVSVADFKKEGYLPDALVNFIALIGWNPKTEREFFTIKDLIKEFDIINVHKAGGIFDREKLNHFNAHYLRAIPNSKLAKMLNTNEKVITIIKERMVKLSDFDALTSFIKKLPSYNSQDLIFRKSDKEKTILALQKVLDKIASENEEISIEKANELLKSVVEENKLTNGDVFWPVRFALSGVPASPSPAELIYVLGKIESTKRLTGAVERLQS